MTWPEIIIHAVVICVGVPAALRNWTALALVASWALGQGTWMVTGDNLPLKIYFLADLTVIGVILAKEIVKVGPKEYNGIWHQLRCLIKDLTVQDRWIIAVFVAGCWPLYVISIGAYERWWMLYYITIAQFLLAGWEALSSWRGAKRAVHDRTYRQKPGGLKRMAGNWGHG